MSPSGRSDSLVFLYSEDLNSIASPHSLPFHRRSCSANDAAFLSNLEDKGGGCGFVWRPCVYFTRGFCKNGSTCKFLHSDIGDGEGIEVETPSKNNSAFDELLRVQALQQRRSCSANDAAFLSNLEDGGGGCGFVWRPCVYFARGFCKNGSTCKFLRSDIGDGEGIEVETPGKNNSAFDELLRVQALQQRRNIFHQWDYIVVGVQAPGKFQKRCLDLSHLSTQKLLSSYWLRDPHFVCDSRVLVKPYKEKGKILDKQRARALKLQHEHIEGVDYSVCLSPSVIDSREQLDIPFGSRMLFGAQELMLRRKLEQEAELKHAIEFQGRRLMNLGLMDLKNQSLSHPFPPRMPSSYPHFSRRQFQLSTNQILSSYNINSDVSKVVQELAKSTTSAAKDEKLAVEDIETSTNYKIDTTNKVGSTCKFLHSDIGDGEGIEVETPSKNNSAFDELLRVQALQQRRCIVVFYGLDFVCDSRVLVKPYKEKGKILDKKLQHEHIEGVDYSKVDESRTNGPEKPEPQPSLSAKNAKQLPSFLSETISVITNQILSSYNINSDVSKVVQELAKSTTSAAKDEKLAVEDIETSTNYKIDIDHKQDKRDSRSTVNFVGEDNSLSGRKSSKLVSRQTKEMPNQDVIPIVRTTPVRDIPIF
ncbi:zinc finger CCCH domain-containing protein 22 [Dorcoceras hygrometricum]|uniref:Zinc finger CCCH domain-containing protein 22 n=1 Tax=Dorcoceras hygrometricum TaxID=472368 RepID=A0A2Z7CFZ4_9LAMI|nr:zinc finger CCCH domain-containing protein 22 [Dorcoceras hygrometricum]